MSLGTKDTTFEVKITLKEEPNGRKSWYGMVEKKARGATLDCSTFQLPGAPPASVGALVGIAISDLLGN